MVQGFKARMVREKLSLLRAFSSRLPWRCGMSGYTPWILKSPLAYIRVMKSEASVPPTAETIHVACERPFHHSLCWGAVLAGTVVAIGIHLLLTALGAGAGLALGRPLVDANSIPHFGAGAAIVWSLLVIIALSFGGWVAGRYSGCLRSGLMHGVLVWGLALCLTLPWLALGAAWAGGRAMKKQGESQRISSQALALAEDDMAQAAAKRSHGQLDSFVKEAVQSITTNAAPKASTRAEREVGFAVTKLFAPENTAAFPANRLEVINALMVYTEMSTADATTTIDAWITSNKNLQAELDKVRVEMDGRRAAAEQTAKASSDELANQRTAHVARVARWSFFALLIGLLGASLSGRCGARCAARNSTGQNVVGTAA